MLSEFLLKLYDYNVSYGKEVPGCIALVLSFSGCTNRCRGCHSPWLQSDEGKRLTGVYTQHLLKRYAKHVDVVCFLGGESEVQRLRPLIKGRGLDIAVYTGKESLDCTTGIKYLKTGPYMAEKGGLDTVGSNQKMVDLETDEDITWRFRND